ncbi:MAG: class I SAM-dependent methyltransferase [Candidatus Heimdallarchaeota archaeon]|nr:class I SAM-dependent methyltransferase [Candidatus Heimdallarchaeota archaeon]
MSPQEHNLKPTVPEIIISEVEVFSYYDMMDPLICIPELMKGNYVLVEDFYHNGLQVLEALTAVLREQKTGGSYQHERSFRNTYRKASQKLLLLVIDHELVVRKAPQIGWFKRFYPDDEQFLISFPNVQGLNSSYQWYKKGLRIPELGIILHPYYGIYFPTRFDHLLLFEEWLQQYNGNTNSAVDVGVGSGVLSLQLLNHGFSQVTGTDVNINAVIGAREERERWGTDNLTVVHGDLLTPVDTKVDLIVFNPPWIQVEHELAEGIEQAIYYQKGLFKRFFDQAEQKLAFDGLIVILFSNLESIHNDQSHPVKQELEDHVRFIQRKLITSSVSKGSVKSRRKKWRQNEQVELWVLEHTDISTE